MRHVSTDPRGFERSRVQKNGRRDRTEVLRRPQETQGLWMPQRVLKTPETAYSLWWEALTNRNMMIVGK